MGRSSDSRLPALLLAFGLGSFSAASPAAAQGLVIRDGTIGSVPEGIVPDGFDDLGQHADYLIRADLGEQRGGNLFHSFSSFSIGSGEWATFTSQGAPDPGAIGNVISRVTGGSESRIDGTLRSTIPGADVWLLNPSGVVFGEGARLDVPGSFHASTGDSVEFEGGLERFQADPSRESVLSTARPEAFGFLGEGATGSVSVDRATLRVPTGETLELVGGDVTLTRATLSAPGGDVSIRGGHILVEQGSRVLAQNVGAIPAGTITFDASESLDVDASLLSVTTSGSGDAGTIALTGGDVRFRNGLGPNAIPTSVGAAADTLGPGKGGAIEIEADSLEVTTGAGLTAETIGPFGGAGGRIGVHVPAGPVQIASGGSLRVNSVVSPGNAGDIDITADSLTLDALDPRTGRTAQTLIAAWPFGGVTAFEPETPARGGTIDITARTIELRNGTAPTDDVQIGTQCLHCTSRAGDITIDAKEAMRVDGKILANTFFAASGDGGNITIGAGSLEIAPGGIVAAGVGPGPASSGTGGKVEIVDTGSLVIAPGGFVGANAEVGSSGNAGTVSIATGSLVIAPGGTLGAQAETGSSGNAGKVSIDADSVHVGANAQNPPRRDQFGVISAHSSGSGDAGSIEIGTLDDPVGSLLIAPGGIVVANANGASSGRGGEVRVFADSVHIGPHPDVPEAPRRLPPSFISASGRVGDSGTIDVQATQSIFLTYEEGRLFDLLDFLDDPPGTVPFLSGVFVAGSGGGSVTLRAPDVTITQGAIVSAATIGGGRPGGNVSVTGSRILVSEGGDVNSASVFDPVAGTGGGDAGSVKLEATGSISVVGRSPEFDVSRVTSDSVGSGAAGAVTLTAPRIRIDGGAVTTLALPFEGEEGERGGQISLNGRDLLVRGGGVVAAGSFIAGPAGSVDARASESIVVDGEGSLIAGRTGGSGKGGDVRLEAPRIEVSHGGLVSASSEAGGAEVRQIFPEIPDVATGDAGNVTLVADKVLLDGGTIATNAEAADGGDITIQARKLLHLDRGVITAAVVDGSGGNITIDPEVMILENESRIVANAGRGSGGNIRITAENYFAFPGTVVDASSELGVDGTVEVHAPDVDLAGKIAPLPTTFLDAASLMREPCAARRTGDRAGSFSVRGNGGIPPEPDGWLPAVLAFDGTSEPTAALAPPTLAGVPALAATGCP